MLTALRADASTSTARPKLARSQDSSSELLMSYYQSPLADQGISYRPSPAHPKRRSVHRRSTSGNSTSSSDYSSDGDQDTSEHSAEPIQPTTRRSSVPSEGGADRRRLAIVQMDPVREADSSGNTSKPTVRSRRGLETRLDGLALMAPPDAAPKSYAYLTPPTSAPPPPSAPCSSSSTKNPTRDPHRPRPPVFQEPHSSRSSSPNPAHLSPPKPKRQSTDLSIHTPEIGQAKEIHVPVASPVIVDLGPDASLRVGNSSFDRRSPALQVVEPRATSPLPLCPCYRRSITPATARNIYYRHDRPSTTAASALGSPPPLRRGDHALQLPGSITAALSSSGSNTPTSTSRSISPAPPIDLASSGSGDDESNDDRTHHRREGAFSPSTISTTPSASPSDYSPTTAHPIRSIDGLIPNVSDASKSSESSSGSSSSSSAVASPVIIAAPPRMESLPEHSGEEQWTHVSREFAASPSSDGHVSQDRVSWESYSPRPSQEGDTPSPPPKGFKASLTTGLKRFSSLPRTPSSRSSSRGRSPSPSVQPVALPSIHAQMPRRKIISQNPAALFCADIVSRKSAQERCSMYAQKINELLEWAGQTGDSDALDAARCPAAAARFAVLDEVGGDVPHAGRRDGRDGFVHQARRQRPARPDPPISRPIPAFAHLPPPPVLNAHAPDEPHLLLQDGQLLLVARPQGERQQEGAAEPDVVYVLGRGEHRAARQSPPVTPNPRPVFISNTPSVPGGPRAPPNRALRTQSIMASSPFSSNSSDRSSSLRRAGLALHAHLFVLVRPEHHGWHGAERNRDFERQVDKLADLLPQAERAVLAGYLRRAGQDILAIGQFLEDEKNGTLRRD
ncbi:hypothetical protein B0H17DRAFT_1135672 [Mycena rosella]|uniref:Uncharacterized protein n=1 Tax=Mycena rosella TaxID=1033263 RepID=A0AAD7GFB8_MYCRO|nr:hypothetical protein B0H17DRAFT_1135672 [Mycena rosella]